MKRVFRDSFGVNQDLTGCVAFQFMVHAKSGSRNRVVAITVCGKKYREPASVTNVKASHLGGDTFAHAHGLAWPQSSLNEMRFRHFKRWMAEQTGAVTVPFGNKLPSARLRVPFFNDVIDHRAAYVCPIQIVANNHSGWTNAVVGKTGVVNLCGTFNTK
jgi:hypothetical protein